MEASTNAWMRMGTFKASEERLYKAGYYVNVMADDKDFFEISNGNGKTLITYLTLGHIEELAEILAK